MKKYLLGYDIGSSSVKASLVSIETGKSVASAFYPDSEAPIKALNPGWAEQEPEDWWKYLKNVTAKVKEMSGAKGSEIEAIGISYQMHGLVCVDKSGKALRPAIIWCDSRAVPYGEKAFREIGKGQCLTNLLNSPGNFTAAKLAWVKENEPELYAKIDKIMLPGDYIAMRLTGTTCTTVSGLSEGMMWNFKENDVAEFLLDYYGISKSLIPEIRPTFSEQGRVSLATAKELGLEAGIPVTYRAGDQPNNALSLNVFNPGEIAATAGTSGVVYGVNGSVNFDPQSRVNNFAHVNHTAKQTRLGVLLCINGTGILNAWTRRNIMLEGLSYGDMNKIAQSVPVGCDGVSVLPFGNGAERVLGNRNVGCSIHGFNFNIHNRNHMARAVQEPQGQPDRYGHRGGRCGADELRQRLFCRRFAPFGRVRGRQHRGSLRRMGIRSDQDRSARARRAYGQVQSAPEDRGRARFEGGLLGQESLHSLKETGGFITPHYFFIRRLTNTFYDLRERSVIPFISTGKSLFPTIVG